MPRFLPAAIAIATLALPGARAAADARAPVDTRAPVDAPVEECMCLGPDTLFVDRSDEESGAGLEGEILESPDDTIETIDPTIPTPSVEEGPRPARGPVAWCRSADDPSCQRDDSGEAPYRITLGHAAIAALIVTPRIPAPGVERVRFPRSVEHGPSGVAFPLDRPPRA